MSDLVEAATLGNQVEADLARLYLESWGIDGTLFDEGIASTHIFGPPSPIRLMVLDTDLDRALKLLREYFKANEKSDRDRSRRGSDAR